MPEPGLDHAENESVWQYLKTYSIYQDRVPERPFIYSPETMFDLISDTLRVDGRLDTYTRYLSDDEIEDILRTIGAADVQLSSSGSDLVSFTSVTKYTGILTISTFNSFDVYRQFLNCVNKIPSTCKNIILDLRHNGGGYISEADSIIEAFLPRGKEYIKARERNLEIGSDAATLDWHSKFTNRPPYRRLDTMNIAVWMDYYTASASEIVAVALKECADAKLVGSRSLGKGIGQIVYKRNNRRWLKITFMQLKGVTKIDEYHGIGIKPDVATHNLTDIVRLFEPEYRENTEVVFSNSMNKISVPAFYKIIDEDSLLEQ